MHILIVEDEENIRMLATEVLEDEGWTIEVAKDGFEALKAIEEAGCGLRGGFDLILLDIKMPGMDGIDVLNIIKNADPHQDVILWSAYGEFKRDFGCWRADAYVVKSADMSEIKHVIRSVCHL